LKIISGFIHAVVDTSGLVWRNELLFFSLSSGLRRKDNDPLLGNMDSDERLVCFGLGGDIPIEAFRDPVLAEKRKSFPSVMIGRATAASSIPLLDARFILFLVRRK